MAKKRKKPEPFTVGPVQYLTEGSEARVEKVAQTYDRVDFRSLRPIVYRTGRVVGPGPP